MPQFTAVVLDADGVRFVAAAHSQRELEAQVVDYIHERCDPYVLWPRVAANVRELIARDRKSAAIAADFANVGQRWDPERLELLDGNVFRADVAAVDDHAEGALPLSRARPPRWPSGLRAGRLRPHSRRAGDCDSS